MGKIESFRDLQAYQQACALDYAVFLETRGRPSEEKFALVDQVRRSSRSLYSAREIECITYTFYNPKLTVDSTLAAPAICANAFSSTTMAKFRQLNSAPRSS